MKIEDIELNHLEQWQNIVDLIARISNVRSAAITRVIPPDRIEAFKVSKTPGNPIKEGLQVLLSEHYCEEVINRKDKVLVENACNSKRWCKAPEISKGLVSYMGFPLFLSDGDIFGTICIHDDKENSYSPDIEELLMQLKKIVEAHFSLAKQAVDLKEQMNEIRELKGIIPICANCKDIRNDQGYWQKVESYIKEHSDADFSHGICPVCAKKLYPEYYTKNYPC